MISSTFNCNLVARAITSVSLNQTTHLSKRQAERSTAFRGSWFNPVFYVLLCLLVFCSNAEAAPLQSPDLDDSFVYQSLLRSSNFQQPDSLAWVRTRRSSEVPQRRSTESMEMNFGKRQNPTPRLCYFSPIQCLFTRGINLNRRK